MLTIGGCWELGGTVAREVRSLLLGTFDNEEQAREAASNGTPTASEGGHEFVTANIVGYGHESSMLVATSFLDGDKKRTFR